MLLESAAISMSGMVLALLLDLTWGEPPVRWHPVVGMGHFLSWAGRWVAPAAGHAQPDPDAAAWTRGTMAWLFGAVVFAGLAWLLTRLMESLPDWAHVLCLGITLKPMLAWRMLREEVTAVEHALAESLHAGRERLGRLCSRDVQQLDAVQVRETAIETLAENLNDSVIAPLFWFALAGLPGAVLYRFVNTADAMWGYRGEHAGRDWTWAGQWAARADDWLSWWPARLTAAGLVWASGRLWLPGLRRQAQRTPSPNGGWPMGAMALLLGVRLGKPGVYLLHTYGRAVQSEDTERACRLAGRTTAWALLALCVLSGVVHV